VPQRWNNDRIERRVLFDRSLTDVFANDGESVITDPVYPTQPLERIDVLPSTAGRHGTHLVHLGAAMIYRAGSPSIIARRAHDGHRPILPAKPDWLVIVAVKVLTPEAAATPEMRVRFAREARAMAGRDNLWT
jgi:hypothetical protein